MLGWQLSNSVLPTGGVVGLQAFAFDNRVYFLGGYTGSADNHAIYSAPVDSMGNLGLFKPTDWLPSYMNNVDNCLVAQSPTPPGTLYVLGGQNGAGTSVGNAVAIGQPRDNGTFSWSQGPQLPQPLFGGAAAIVNGWLYAIGGLPSPTYTGNIHAVAGDIALAIVSGNAVTFTLSAGAAWAVAPVVGQYVVVDTTSVLYSAHAANGGWYRVTSIVSGVSFHATKISNLTGSTAENSAPIAVGATPVAEVTDLDLVLGTTRGSAGTVWASKIQDDASLGAWVLATNVVIGGGAADDSANVLSTGPDNYWVYGAAVGSQNYLYVAGGMVAAPNGTVTSFLPTQAIYRGTPQGGNGAVIAWEVENSILSSPRANASLALLTPGKMIMAGGTALGATAGSALQTVDEFSLNTDGRLRSVTQGSELPVAQWQCSPVACNGWLFLLGGMDASSDYLATIYQAPIYEGKAPGSRTV